MTLPAQNLACITTAVLRECDCADSDELDQFYEAMPDDAKRSAKYVCVFCTKIVGFGFVKVVYLVGRFKVCADCAQAALAADVMERSET